MSVASVSASNQDQDEVISPEPDVDVDDGFDDGNGANSDTGGDDDYDDRPAPRRRKRPCPSSAVISASVRHRVRNAASNECWLCGLNGRHVAHILGKADIALVCDPRPPPHRPQTKTNRSQFQTYKAQGLLHMPTIHAIDNLIYLCAGCHDGFDERVPVWAFLPVDLDTIITTEVDFHRARDTAAANGTLLRRPPPTIIPNLPYARYQIRPKAIFDHVFLDRPIRNWIGSPIAVILRSVGIAAGQTRLPATVGGLPGDVSLKLQHLLHLFATPPPEPTPVAPVPRPLRVVSTTPVSDKQRRNIPSRRIPRSGPSQHPQVRPSETDSTSNPDTKRKKVAATSGTVRQGEVRRRRRGNGGVRFGAHMTADMIRGWYVTTQVKGMNNSS